MPYPGTLAALVARDRNLRCTHHDGNDINTPTGSENTHDEGNRVLLKGFRARGKATTGDGVITRSASQFASVPPRRVFRPAGSGSTPPQFGDKSISPCDHGRMMDRGMFATSGGTQSDNHLVDANFQTSKAREDTQGVRLPLVGYM